MQVWSTQFDFQNSYASVGNNWAYSSIRIQMGKLDSYTSALHVKIFPTQFWTNFFRINPFGERHLIEGGMQHDGVFQIHETFLQTACKSPKLCQWWCCIFAMMKECLHIRNFHLCSGKLLSYEFHNFKRLFQPTLLCLDWGIFCRHSLAAALCWVAGVVKPAPKHDANCPEFGEFFQIFFWDFWQIQWYFSCEIDT